MLAPAGQRVEPWGFGPLFVLSYAWCNSTNSGNIQYNVTNDTGGYQAIGVSHLGTQKVMA